MKRWTLLDWAIPQLLHRGIVFDAALALLGAHATGLFWSGEPLLAIAETACTVLVLPALKEKLCLAITLVQLLVALYIGPKASAVVLIVLLFSMCKSYRRFLSPRSAQGLYHGISRRCSSALHRFVKLYASILSDLPGVSGYPRQAASHFTQILPMAEGKEPILQISPDTGKV